MKQYLYLFIIYTMLNIVRGLIIHYKYDTIDSLYKSKPFLGMIIVFTILYFIVFFIMFIIHLILNKLYNISDFNTYIWSIFTGFVLYLIYFIFYLGQSLLEILFNIPIFMICYILLFLILIPIYGQLLLVLYYI